MPTSTFIMDDGCRRTLMDAGIVSVDSAFAATGGKDLAKANIGKWRKRIEIKSSDGSIFFMKRYEKPPVMEQIKSWLSHGRIDSFGGFDIWPSADLARNGIQTPHVAAHGHKWGPLFEKRSVSITEKIPYAESLERRLPACFSSKSKQCLREKRAFLQQFGQWVARFHSSGWRHRDLYLSHIFLNDKGCLYLIDLQRAFKPDHLAERYRRKDLAQLYYSMPHGSFSRTDRLRLYMAYSGSGRLKRRDRRVIAGILVKVGKMAEHDRRHSKIPPYKNSRLDNEA